MFVEPLTAQECEILLEAVRDWGVRFSDAADVAVILQARLISMRDAAHAAMALSEDVQRELS